MTRMHRYDASDYRFSKDASSNRYLVHHHDEVAGFMSYREHDGTIVIDHTVVDDAHQGQGVAARLVEFGIRDLAERTHGPVVASCSYVAMWLRRHPEFAALAERGRAE